MGLIPNDKPGKVAFFNAKIAPWTANAVRLRVARLRLRAGLAPDGGGEEVVAYTLRHTAATEASARGLRDRLRP